MNNQRHTGGALVIVPHTADDHTKVTAPDQNTTVIQYVPKRIANWEDSLFVPPSTSFSLPEDIIYALYVLYFTSFLTYFSFTVAFTCPKDKPGQTKKSV